MPGEDCDQVSIPLRKFRKVNNNPTLKMGIVVSIPLRKFRKTKRVVEREKGSTEFPSL